MDQKTKFKNFIIRLKQIVEKGKIKININPRNVDFLIDENYLKKELNLNDEEYLEKQKIIQGKIKPLVLAIISNGEEEFIYFHIKDYEGEKRKKIRKDIEEDLEIIKEYFVDDSMYEDYYFKNTMKEFSFNSIEWSISNKIYDSTFGESNDKYATINLNLNEENNVSNQDSKLSNKMLDLLGIESIKTTSFVCNKTDINYMLSILNNIKEKLGEDKDV